MRGITRPLELPLRITAALPDHRHQPGRGASALGALGHLILDRRPYGVGTEWRHTAIPDFIGDEITVEIDLWTRGGRPLPPAEEEKK
jgi:hypothetical protein